MRQRFVVEIVDESSPPASNSGGLLHSSQNGQSTTTSLSDTQSNLPNIKTNQVAGSARSISRSDLGSDNSSESFSVSEDSSKSLFLESEHKRGVHTKQQPTAADYKSPDDLYISRQKNIDALLMEEELQSARQENAKIDQPALTKRQQREIQQSVRERAFQEELQHTKKPKSKIEQFYKKQIENQAELTSTELELSWLDKTLDIVFGPPKSRQKKKNVGSPRTSKTSLKEMFEPSPLGLNSDTHKKQKRNGGSSIRLSGIAKYSFGVVLGVSIILASAFWVGYRDFVSAQEHLEGLILDISSGQIKSAEEHVRLLQSKEDRYNFLYRVVRPLSPIVLGQEKTTSIDKLFVLADSGLLVTKKSLDTYSQLHSGYSQFMNQKSGSSIETLTQVSGQLEAVFTELSSFQAELNSLDNSFNIDSLTHLRTKVNASFPDIRRAVLAAQQMSFALPELLGESGKKQYLVLLQNNEELRPTGGFIGSFAILTVEKGKFVDFRVEDVYEADGQLQGYVAPPPEIIEHLGEAQWFLRDVNWNPNFPTVAQQAGWFLDKEIGIAPDGVLAINLHVAQKLLEVTGPIELVDYDEIITKDNLFERAEMHSEINFFPGSTQKRDFLSAVANALFTRLTQEDSNTMAIMKALYESAEESQLFIAMNAPAAAQAFTNLGWSGAVLSPECPSPFPADGCFVDTVMQVEANVGVNKANQYIERSIEQKTEILNNSVQHTRTMTFVNTADSNAWPEGAYKNYLRLFVPQNAQLTSISLNGSNLDLSTVRDTVESDSGKRSFGFLVNVPIRSSVVAEVAYQVPIPVDKQQVYSLFEQKQSGTGPDDVTHFITISEREVLTVAPEPIISGRTLQFSSNRLTHEFMAVEMR